jgi:hypothetical protein
MAFLFTFRIAGILPKIRILRRCPFVKAISLPDFNC